MKNFFHLSKRNITLAFILLPVLSLLFIFNNASLATSNSVDENVKIDNINSSELCLHFFYKTDCPDCSEVNDYLKSVETNYNVNIEKYNIEDGDNKNLYQSFKDRYGLVSSAYPVIFMGDNYLMGDKTIKNNLKKEIEKCQETDCPCPLAGVRSGTPSVPQVGEFTPEESSDLFLPIVGDINFSAMPIYFTTAIIAFVDGFNPCSLWLITFLIGIVIYTRSKKKILLVGGTFLLVTGGVYALFMAGLLNVFSYVGYLDWIQIVVALMAFIFALVNIKDYFWYKKGISFTISDKHKPKIFKNMRGIMKSDNSSWQMVLGTAVLALGVVLIELPCTAGFPVVWTNILAQNGIEGAAFYSLLTLYMLIYLLDEVFVLAVAAWTMKTSRFEEKHGRMLKLIGGLVMLSLAVVMLVDPNLMHDVGSSIMVFVGSILLAFIIMYIHRYLLPKFGIRIGSEKEIKEKVFEKDNEKENK
jgi:cytochrome c biogenesis protein CcdA/glutaredoxin